MIELQHRDEQILRLAYDHQFVQIEHVRAFYPEASQRSEPNRRLGELRRAGFLRQERPATGGGLVLYRLTRSGRAWVESRGGVMVRMKKRIALATLLHDSRVALIRLRLLTFWNAQFVPERAIKEDAYSTIPDGIFFFPSGRGIALEFENSDKGKKRFLKLCERWRDASSIVAILYVGCDDKMSERLKKYLLDGPKEKPIGVVSLPNLLTGMPKVWTVRGEFAWFEKRSF